jgi:HEAT repeat protein
VEPFVAEFIDQRGVRQRARIQANWLMLLHFRFSPVSFEKGCRLALAEGPAADIREVRTYTGGDRDPLLIEMGELALLSADAPADRPAAPAAGAVERQMELLKADDVSVRIEAARALARFGPAAEKAIPALVEAIRDELRRDPTNTQFPSVLSGQRGRAGFWAAEALGEIGPAAVPHVAGLLSDKERRMHVYAAWALRKIGPPARKTAPALCQALTDDLYTFESNFIAAAVVAVGPTEEMIPALIRSLEGEHPVRAWAALGLAKIGPAAVPTSSGR